MTLSAEVIGRVIEGTKAASGLCHFTDYGGTIALQRPYFVKAGISMTRIYNGTINVDISPKKFTILGPEVVVANVRWHPTASDRSETFWFVPCMLLHNEDEYEGLVYFPHPDTKIGTFPGFSVIEVLAPFVLNLGYGHQVLLRLPCDLMEIRE